MSDTNSKPTVKESLTAHDTKPQKLTANQKHLLKLIRRGISDYNWTPVSKAVYPLLDTLPARLIETLMVNDKASVRLTTLGNNIVDAMEWL